MKYSRELVSTIDSLSTRHRLSFPEIHDETFWMFYEKCKDFSLVHVTGFYNIYQSMTYLKKAGIDGAIVECGCFLGGVAAFMGLMREHLGMTGVPIYLFDTFEGPPIGSEDVTLLGAVNTPAQLPDYYDTVLENIISAVGSAEGYIRVRGLVEDTLPNVDPDLKVSLLRLDTDFYGSTKIELVTLYPRLATGGVLIVDDYGMFQGSRRATDEYLSALEAPPLLNRIDIGIWAGVKP